MYTSSAAQHLLSQSSFKVFASESSAFGVSTLKRRLAVAASVSHFLSPCSLREACHSRELAVRWKGSLPALRALGYYDGEDDDDDVYVKSFRPSRGSPQPRVGERSREPDSRASSDDSTSYPRGSTSAQGEQSGFKAGFRAERGGRGRGGRGGGRGGLSGGGSSDSRDSFPRSERGEGENVVSNRGNGGRGPWSNRGGRGAGRGRGSISRGTLLPLLKPFCMKECALNLHLLFKFCIKLKTPAFSFLGTNVVLGSMNSWLYLEISLRVEMLSCALTGHLNIIILMLEKDVRLIFTLPFKSIKFRLRPQVFLFMAPVEFSLE